MGFGRFHGVSLFMVLTIVTGYPSDPAVGVKPTQVAEDEMVVRDSDHKPLP
jgi:hypothetical protein